MGITYKVKAKRHIANLLMKEGIGPPNGTPQPSSRIWSNENFRFMVFYYYYPRAF